jgi:two-component system CheB/CheR fusion protein
MPSDLGRPFDDIKPSIDVPDLDQQVADVIGTLVAKESEVKDRAGRWYRMQIRPYRAADGSVDGAIVSLVDIDALKGNVRDAQAGQADAERADRAKDEFLAVLSHELRTPLSVLVMQTHLLRQGGLDNVKLAHACDRIERSTKMQVRLIEDLLDVSRIVTGKLRIDLQPTDLIAVARASLEGVAGLAKSKSIEMRVYLDPTVGMVFGDRMRLEQVVSNLLANALKFTPKGGKIDLALKNGGGTAYLEVRDNGIGIEAGFLPRIFNRLTQEDSSSTRRHAGLGLGLAIVRHLVEAHGGTVRAESAGPGQGATFFVALPLMALSAEPGKPAPAQAANGAVLDRRSSAVERIDFRVLVVEDDPALCELLGEVLTRAGATVRTADSVAAGMAVFGEFHPDVLVCDIAMPVEDGYAFITKVRALGAEEGGDTPAAALTALAGDADRKCALASGFQLHLTKPVDLDLLAGALAGLVDDAHQQIRP